MILPAPMEFLELAPGESRSFSVLSAEQGETDIVRRDDGRQKTIPVLRVHVDPADKPLFPHYYDITSLTLAAQLIPIVAGGTGQVRRFTVTKVGTGPAARFSVESAPAVGSSTPQ